jgi:hypothetical protein
VNQDKVKQDLNNTWLEPVLAEHLRPVTAPGELWNRMQRREKPQRSLRSAWRIGLVAVAALLVAGTSSVLRVHGANPGLSLQSGSAPEIQAWVKENTGLDVPLPASLARPVRLSGARVAGKGVEVDYFVRNRPERLMIARADGQDAVEHRFLERGLKKVSLNKVSWTMDGQFYALDCATAEDAQAACMLCHT